jgi:hypothetical protein
MAVKVDRHNPIRKGPGNDTYPSPRSFFTFMVFLRADGFDQLSAIEFGFIPVGPQVTLADAGR